MILVGAVCSYLDQFAPEFLAESWDNTGLLLGQNDLQVSNVMTCLTITPEVVQEAIDNGVTLIVSHHPMPFKPLSKISDASYYGAMVWDLARNGVCVYSPHTRFDSTKGGINQQIADAIGLVGTLPLEVREPLEVRDATAETSQAMLMDDSAGGASQALVGRGRWGRYEQPESIAEIAKRLKLALAFEHLKHVTASDGRPISRVAIGCGSAGDFLRDAKRLACDLLILGETTFHTCLEAHALDVDLLLVGHYRSERFAVEQLVSVLALQFPTLKIWASQCEQDPIQWL